MSEKKEKEKAPKADDKKPAEDKPKAAADAPRDAAKSSSSNKAPVKDQKTDSEGSEEGKKKSTQDSDSSSAALKKARSKKKSRHQDSTSVSKGQTVIQKKEKEDLEERKDMEKNLSRLTTQLAALQERMYSIRFDDSVELEQKHLELRNFANQILFCERQISLAYREAIEVFEDQLQLHEIGLDGVLDPIHAAEVSDAEINRTGSFMRTPSTQTVQGQDPRKKWQAAFKMYKEKKDQTAVAQGQYVATRDSSLTDLDEEITKLRNAVMALRGRKSLNPRDERTLELMQEQLKVRVQQKERAARQILGSH